MDDWSFWVGVMISLPIAILANFLTPILKRRIDNAGEKKLKVRKEELEREFNKVQNFIKNPSLLSSYLISIVIKTTFVGALAGIIVGLLSLFSQWQDRVGVLPISWDVHDIFNFLMIIVSVSVSVVIFQLCDEGIKAYNRVNNFEKYKNRVQKQISDMDKNT